MPRVRVVTRLLPCIRALRGRPVSPAIEERLARALDPEKIELIIEPDAEKRMAAVEEADFFFSENDPLPGDFYERAKKLKLIQAGGYFFEKLQIERATGAGVPVMTFPMPITDSVADHVIAMLLALARNFEVAVRAAREGSGNPASPKRADGSAYNWTQTQGIAPLRGMRLGVLGMGDIGRGVALRARAFGMEIIYWNRTPLPESVDEALSAKPVAREELFRNADALLVGVGLNDETRGIVGEKEIRALPRGAYLLNIGRGALIDQEAMYRALSDGHLGGAGLDVFDPEPLPASHPLLRLPNVIPTPHCAGGDDENIITEIEIFFANIHRALAGEAPLGGRERRRLAGSVDDVRTLHAHRTHTLARGNSGRKNPEKVGEVPPRYNVSPGTDVLIVRSRERGTRELGITRWGLVPFWAKDSDFGAKTINARSETAAQKPAFRSAFRYKRCLIPADGFYEWAGSGRKKQPFFIHLENRKPFAFAGLWESWTGADGSVLETCAILTTEANEKLAELHHRMPVILPQDSYADWLNPAENRAKAIQPHLRPYPSDAFAYYPVSERVNSPRNDDAACIENAQRKKNLPSFRDHFSGIEAHVSDDHRT